MMDAYNEEMSLARLALRCRNYTMCFAHLERAHVLTQRITAHHVYVHWMMLIVGWQQRDYREVVGQVSRMFAALMFSRFWVPIGNTGRARVNALKPMAVPRDLYHLVH